MGETVFVYSGRDRQGKLVRGRQRAANKETVIRQLRQSNIYPLEVKQAPRLPDRRNITLPITLPRPNWRHWLEKPVKSRDLAIFSRQFHTLIEAGVPMLNALQVLQQQTANPKLKRAINSLQAGLQQGATLSESIARHPTVFPYLYAHLVEAGELGGVLDKVMDSLSVTFEKDHQLKEKIKSALIYPAVIITMTMLVVAALQFFVLPNLVGVLLSLQVPLPATTRILLGVNSFLQHYWFTVPPIFFCLFLTLRLALKTDKGRYYFSAASLKAPIFGRLVGNTIVARFCRTFGELLKSGVPILVALEVVQKSTGNVLFVQALSNVIESIRAGQGLARPLAESGVFPPLVVQMISVGEESGALEKLLEKAAVFYENEVEAVVTRLTAVIEPVMIVIMGGMVGFIAISVLMPLMTLVGRMSQ
ncbi:type II secretion system F family protein [Desulfurispora thermophila]|uniref:type II secretion system F family protein n=1 Tax=Desulfurispora thermophila TaxID=265470 RepID=UPI0003781E22|nr:type II secretion system F family protein [Desulfurispora thermophila]